MSHCIRYILKKNQISVSPIKESHWNSLKFRGMSKILWTEVQHIMKHWTILIHFHLSFWMKKKEGGCYWLKSGLGHIRQGGWAHCSNSEYSSQHPNAHLSNGKHFQNEKKFKCSTISDQNLQIYQQTAGIVGIFYNFDSGIYILRVKAFRINSSIASPHSLQINNELIPIYLCMIVQLQISHTKV